jgi:hypothetical protein
MRSLNRQLSTGHPARARVISANHDFDEKLARNLSADEIAGSLFDYARAALSFRFGLRCSLSFKIDEWSD